MFKTSSSAAWGQLVPYKPNHDEKTVQWLNSATLRATFGMRRSITLESHRRWVESAQDTLMWAVNNAEGNHVGNVLLKINTQHRAGYFQMYIGESEARGKGLGNKALAATLKNAFEKQDLHRIWLHTFPDNLAAEALYKKHGFVSEGFEREAILADGIFLSQRRWSLLIEEWRKANGCEFSA